MNLNPEMTKMHLDPNLFILDTPEMPQVREGYLKAEAEGKKLCIRLSHGGYSHGDATSVYDMLKWIQNNTEVEVIVHVSGIVTLTELLVLTAVPVECRLVGANIQVLLITQFSIFFGSAEETEGYTQAYKALKRQVCRLVANGSDLNEDDLYDDVTRGVVMNYNDLEMCGVL